MIHVAVSAVSVLNHDMWRDEVEAWLLATTMPLSQLYRFLAYTGHPSLWYLLLRAIHFLGAPMAGMAALNLAFASLTVYLVARFAPFSRLQKALFAFGYFYAFEYAVISRDYGLAVLLLTSLCVISAAARPRPILIAVVTGLICHTNTHALLVALPIAALGLFECFEKIAAERTRGDAWRQCTAAAAILMVSAVSAVWLIKAPPDSPFSVAGAGDLASRLIGLFTLDRARFAMDLLVSGYAPVPAPTLEFMNTNLLASSPALVAAAHVAAVVLVITAIACLPGRRALIFAATTGGLILFFMMIYSGGVRHHGFLFIAFWTSLWLGARLQRPKQARLLSVAFTVVLTIQAVAGALALMLHAGAPFSQGRRTAAFLTSAGLAGLPIAADYDYAGMTVAGYLGRTVYFPRDGYEGYCVLFNRYRLRPWTMDGVLADVAAHFKGRGRVILVMDRPVPPPEREAYRLEEVAVFNGAIVENFYVYALPGA